ncbi:MAG TPA: peptidoglycan-associated lipoprotein Pal [Vicinamibacteria bacterium]
MRMTQSFRRSRDTAMVALVLAIGLAACGGGKRPPALSGAPPPPSTTAAPEPAQPPDTGPDVDRLDNEGAFGSDLMPSADANTEGGPLADIRFDLDSANLSDAAREILGQHAVWLKDHARAQVTIEGHCDERGTVEYNLALGEGRARAARDYLASLGVDARRLRTVSFGKEKPLDPSANEAAWSKNRRAHFVVTGI